MILERKTANLDLEDEEGPGSYYGDDSLNLVSFDVSKEPAVKSPSQIDNKKNPLPLLSEGIPELEEEGEDVLAIYSNSLRERG